MTSVEVEPMRTDRLTALFSSQRRIRFEDTAATARRLLDGRVMLVQDPALASRLGDSAHDRVREGFLGDQQLEAYVELISTLGAPARD